MKQTQQKQLTENELIADLENTGCKGISKRTVGDWRRDGLLPDFDNLGRGLGKGLGRSESTWDHPELVTEQAEWLHKMRSTGIGYENFHLNLWMLGYDIQTEDVRDSLLEPLVWQIERLESKAQELQQKCGRRNNIFEDIINEDVSEAKLNIEAKQPFDSLIMPDELWEAAANIFLNPEYDLSDFGFAESFTVLEELEGKARKFESDLLKGENIDLENLNNRTQTIFDFLNNADFIQQYFSLHSVEKAVRECTEEELAEVQNDLGIISKIVMIFFQIIQTILPHTSFSNDISDKLLPFLFYMGELFVLGDISLRHNGFAEIINQVRGQVLSKIESEFNETVRQEIENSALVIGRSLTDTIETIEKRLLLLAEASENES